MSELLLPVGAPLSSSQAFINNNPIWLVAQVMMGLTKGQATLLSSMKDQVTKLTRNMTEVNYILITLSAAKSSIGYGDKTTKAVVATSASFVVSPFGSIPGETVAEYNVRANANNAAMNSMIDVAQTMIKYGASTAVPYSTATPPFTVGDLEINYKSLPSPPAAANTSVWTASAVNDKLDSMTLGIKRAVDDISGQVQQAQLELQTMMGRFNGAFLTTTAAVKRYETQMLTVNGNVGR